MSIILPQGEEKTEKSIAKMIEAQYTVYDHINVLGHTEIPKRQLPGIVMLMTLQETLAPLCSQMPDKESFGYDEEAPEQEWNQEGYVIALERFQTGRWIGDDDVAMLNHIAKKFIFSFGLCMRSVDRKIRAEGMRIGSQSGVKETEDNIGLSSKVLQTVGLGKLTKFNKVYVRKGE